MTLEQKLGEEAVREIAGRNFGIDSNSRYSEKEFLERAEDLFRVDACYKKITKNGNDIGALNEFSGIALKYMPGDKGKNAEILKNPFTAEKQAKVLLSSGYKNMVDYTAKNLDNILSDVSEQTLVKTAAVLPDKGKKYAQIVQHLQGGDITAARKAYAETFKNEAWKKFILECPNARIIQHCMKMYIDYKNKEFIDKNLSIQVGSGGEKTYKPNLERARGYVSKTIAGYGAKERNAAYLGIATALYHSKKGIEENEGDAEELDYAA